MSSYIPLLSLQEEHPEEMTAELPFVIQRMEKNEERIKKKHEHQPEIPHRHNYFVIIWIEYAKGVHFVDFKEYPLEENTIFLLNPSQVHLLKTDNIPHGTIMLFTQDFLCQGGGTELLDQITLFKEMNEPFIRLKPNQTPNLQILTNLMFEEIKHQKLLKSEIICTYLKAFLLNCCRYKSENQSFQVLSPDKSIEELSHVFQLLLEKHYHQKHLVADYADLLHITPNYLNEVVKKKTGRSAKEWIQERILLEAKRSAYYSEISSKELAYSLGFEDPSHFGKFFKKETGYTFLEFREKVRNQYVA
jgi:AraC-like DNA-binding protein